MYVITGTAKMPLSQVLYASVEKENKDGTISLHTWESIKNATLPVPETLKNLYTCAYITTKYAVSKTWEVVNMLDKFDEKFESTGKDAPCLRSKKKIQCSDKIELLLPDRHIVVHNTGTVELEKLENMPNHCDVSDVWDCIGIQISGKNLINALTGSAEPYITDPELNEIDSSESTQSGTYKSTQSTQSNSNKSTKTKAKRKSGAGKSKSGAGKSKSGAGKRNSGKNKDKSQRKDETPEPPVETSESKQKYEELMNSDERYESQQEVKPTHWDEHELSQFAMDNGNFLAKYGRREAVPIFKLNFFVVWSDATIPQMTTWLMQFWTLVLWYYGLVLDHRDTEEHKSTFLSNMCDLYNMFLSLPDADSSKILYDYDPIAECMQHFKWAKLCNLSVWKEMANQKMLQKLAKSFWMKFAEEHQVLMVQLIDEHAAGCPENVNIADEIKKFSFPAFWSCKLASWMSEHIATGTHDLHESYGSYANAAKLWQFVGDDNRPSMTGKKRPFNGNDNTRSGDNDDTTADEPPKKKQRICVGKRGDNDNTTSGDDDNTTIRTTGGQLNDRSNSNDSTATMGTMGDDDHEDTQDFKQGMKQWFVKLNKDMNQVTQELNEVVTNVDFDNVDIQNEHVATYVTLLDKLERISKEFKPFQIWFEKEMRNAASNK